MSDDAVVMDDKTLDEELTAGIRETLHEIQSRPPEETGLPAADAPADDPAAPAPAAAPNTDKPRAPDGKFVKGDPAQKSAATAKADTPAPIAATATDPMAADTPTDQALKFGAVAVDLNRAPSSWKPAAKAAWASLPENVRQEIYRRETDFSNTVLNGPLKESADFGSAVRKVVEPYRGLIEAEGGDYTRAIADTMKTAALFRTGTVPAKLQAIFQIDQQFCGGALNQHFLRRVEEEVAKRGGKPADPNAPAQAPQQIQQQPLQDPRVDELLAAEKRREDARMGQEKRIAEDASHEFLQAKDDKGQPLYPFVDNVLDDMVARISAIRRQNPGMAQQEVMKQAYDAAVWANPETRAVLIAAQQAPQVRAAESQQKLEAARRASAGNLPKRGALPAAGPETVLKFGTAESDESIRQTYRQLNGQ